MQRISKAELARRADKARGVKPLQEMEIGDWRLEIED